MPKLISSSQPKLKQPSVPKDELQLDTASIVNKGMFTSFDASDVDDAGLTLAANAVVRYDRTSRRNGNVLYTPVRPTNNQVNHLAVYSQIDGTVNLIRIDSVGNVYSGTSSWTHITSGSPITADATTRFTSIVINNRFFFADDGNDPIQEIDLATNTYAQVGDAPQYKYIVGFGNRIVGAYYTGGPTSNAVLVGWSGDGNYGEWNPAVDLSAGSAPLVDTSESEADPLSGLFATDNRMILLRERSIWLATKQPSASQPFYFYMRIDKLGCDCPYSAVAVPDGVCFLSYRFKSVFLYHPEDAQPQRIGLPIELTLVQSIESLGAVFGAYDPINTEYNLSIKNSSGITRTWKYNFITQAWAYDDIPGVNCMTFIDFSSTSVSMDDLPGTMDSLPGTMDSLGTPSAAAPTRLLGLTSGDIWQESVTALDDNGTPFTTSIASKTFSYPSINEIVGELRLQLQPNVGLGTLQLYYSKNDGNSWTLLKTVTITAPMLTNPILAMAKRQVNTRRYMWKVETTNTKFDLNGYEVHTYPGGESKR